MGCQFQGLISVALIQKLDSLDWGRSEGPGQEGGVKI